MSTSLLDDKDGVEGDPRFMWSPTDEPHATRRREILEKYPEIKELFGHDPNTKWKILLVQLTQLLGAFLVHDQPWWIVVLVAYTYSGTVNHMMTLAIHECSHNLGFKKILHNKLLGIFANLSMGIPASTTFKPYHMAHHKYQGEDVIDVDVPSSAEVSAVGNNWFLKLVWMFLQPAFYALRPMFVNPKPMTKWDAFNWLVVFGYDYAIYQAWGGKALFYLVGGTLLGMGMHPVAGHFIAEHYVFSARQETYSYYGPLNWVAFSVGLHNEHHDFPFIPGSRLHKVRAIAPEYYNSLPHYSSWTGVIWQYITDPRVGPFSRIKRKTLDADGNRHPAANYEESREKQE